ARSGRDGAYRRSGATSAGLLDCCAAHAAHQRASIIGCGVQIVARVEFASKFIERVVERAALDVWKIARRGDVGDAADGEPRAVFVRGRGAGDDGEIAMPSGKFIKRIAVAGRTAR